MATGQKAKRRAVAQQIGKVGELAFARWAAKGLFTANKVDDDFGVDYICQLLEPTGKSGSQEVTGKSVFVQVKTTTGAGKPRIGINRDDAETALRQDGVFAIAGVNLPSEDVYFRWLDIPLMEELHKFLESDRQTLTMRLDSMSQGVDRFAKELRERSKHGQRARFERARVSLGLAAAIPGAKLKMSAGDDDNEWVAVSVPNLLSVVRSGADAHEAVARVMFRPVPFVAGFQEVLARHGLRQQVREAASLVDGRFLVAGGAESDATLTIESNGQRATSSFVLRRVQDEQAYIGASGLILRITDVRHFEATGEHVHEISWMISDEGAVDLVTSGQLDFLRLLVPEARIFLGSQTVPLDGITTLNLSRSILAIEAVYAGLELSMTGVRLSDLADNVFANNLGLLEFLSTPGPVLFGGLLLNMVESDVDDALWERHRYRLPVTLRLKEQAVLAWVSGECDVFRDEGAFCGIVFRTRDDTTFELTDYQVEGDGHAEAHLGGGLEPYILGGPTRGPAQAPKDVPFEMEIFRQAAHLTD